MYCKNCGKEIDNQAVVCPYCGRQVRAIAQKKQETNVLAIIGFIFSFFIALVGLICSILGKKKANEIGTGGGLATAGIVISAIGMAWSFLLILLVACAATL